MAVKTYRPLTPTQRWQAVADFSNLTKKKPEKRLVKTKRKPVATVMAVSLRAIGGGHKQKIRTVDFRRNKTGIEAEVIALSMIDAQCSFGPVAVYRWGKTLYCGACRAQVGDKVMSGDQALLA